MNLSSLKKFCIGSMLGFAAWTTSALAQTPVTVNGAACAGASVMLSSAGIAINTNGCGGSVVTPPSFTSSTPAAATVGVAYSHSFTATNSPAWSITGSAPAGMTFNSSTGVLSGTPTAAGSTTFTINATNSAGSTPQSVTLVVNAAVGPPTISSSAPPAATTGVPYNFTFTAGGAQPITWTVTGLPTGISHAGGVLSGTPTVVGSSTISVTAANGTLPDANAVYTITVSAPVVTPTVTACSGVVGGALTITGTNFVSGSTSATLNALALTLGTVTSTTIASTVPASITTNGSRPLIVTVSGQPSASFSCTITGGPTGDTSVEGVVIPTPSKQPGIPAAFRSGQLNGAGGEINAYAVDVARCAGKSTPALTRSWQHNIDFGAYMAASDIEYIAMNAGEALSYKFVAPASGYRFITFNSATHARYVANFLSITSTPCDFNEAPANNMRACYKPGNGGNNDITYQVTGGSSPVDISACQMTPGQTYYLNLRFWDKVGGVPVDACATSPAGGFNCGGILQVR
ncbi:MAG: putative Ig domain-containing protein [Betaproteobacteria bacterium]|nr:putative Ig domain-containing protein [Betaproteobacteria bacterium]